jgi:4'-phosphopantetheinyl transferase
MTSVRVVPVDLAVPEAVIARLDALLPAAERAARPAVRVLRATTREVLAETVGAAPASLEISRRCRLCGHPTHGKPALTGMPGVSFSVSHSGTIGVIAVAADGTNLGVDIERVRPRRHLAALAARTLGPDALAAWRAAPEAEQLARFLHAWTAKEAYLKAVGTGITVRLSEVPEQPPGWSVERLAVVSGYVGALAVQAPSPSENGGTGG